MPLNQCGPQNNLQVGRDYNSIAVNRRDKVYNYVTSTVLPRLKATLNPFHLSGADLPTCLKGTRTNILNQISEFIDNANCESNVAFLLGAAGTGKTTVATTIADKYLRTRRLGCYLFFLRERSDPMSVIPTIAYNLAAYNKSIAIAIDKALKNCGGLSSASPDSLFNILLNEPLPSVASEIGSPVLIVLDALDECGTSESRKSLLRVLIKWISTLPHNFRFLITSRPEIDIMSFVASIKPNMINLDIFPDENINDVRAYINHELNSMKESEQLVLPNSWPWEDNMEKLVKVANGLFIWASTAIRFIEEEKEGSAEALETLISHRSLNLDGLYESILRNCLSWTESTKTNFPNVFSLIFFGKKPLKDNEIDGIMNLKEGTTRSILCRLRSLVFSEANQNIRIHHASFYDYLVFRASRDKAWYIDSKRQKEMIAEKCFDRMEELLRFNICGLESSFLLNKEVSDLQERIERNIPLHLIYICCNWAHHLRDTSYTQRLGDLLRIFAYNKLLFWFEVLSLTDTFDSYVGIALTYAISWLRSNDPELSSFLRDAHRQATVFSDAVSQSVPHIYCSLLPLTKDESVVSLHYKKYASPVAHIEYIGDRQRSAVIEVIKSDCKCIEAISFSLDGTRIVSASENDVCMWDATSGKLITSLKYHANRIAFSLDGDLVALALSWEENRMITVWSPMEGEIARELCTDDTGGVCSITFSKSGKYIASGHDNGKILIWDVENGSVHGKPLEDNRWFIAPVSFSYDDQYLVSGSDDGTIVLWNLQSRQMIYDPLKGHTRRINTIAFSPTARYFVSGSEDRTARIWETSTGNVIRQFEECTQAAYSSDGLQILGYDGHGTFKIWNMLNVDGPPRELKTSYRCGRVAFSPDGTRFAFVRDNINTIELYDATVDVIDTEQKQVQKMVTSLAVSPRGRYIASGGLDGTICVWNAVSGKPCSEPWKRHTDTVMSVAFSRDGKLVASGSRDTTVRVWEVSSGETVAIFDAHTLPVTSVAFSPNVNHLASGSEDCTIRVWNVERRELALTPLRGGGGIRSIAYSPDGSKIISGSDDGINIARIWNATTGQLLSTLEGHSRRVHSVAYSRDGLRVLSVSDDKNLRLWNAESGKIESMMSHDTVVTSACLSPDGMRFLTGSLDGTIHVWNTFTHELHLGPLVAHSDRVHLLYFFPHKKKFTTSSYDGTIKIWSMGDVDWDLRRDGWAVDKDNKLLMWLPKGLRETLITPRNPIIINVPYNTRVDFSRYRVGNEWATSIVASG